LIQPFCQGGRDYSDFVTVVFDFPSVEIVVVTDVVMLEEVVEASPVLLPHTLIVVTVLPSGEIIVFVSQNLFLSIISPHFIILKQTVLALISGLWYAKYTIPETGVLIR
jgi:hypothetical protein